MALTSVGYEGQVDESQIARAAQHFGPPVVEGADDFKVEAVSGLDRTVRVLPGAADACFVRVVNDVTTNKQSTTVESGKRWDTAVLRRDWTPPAGGATTLELVPGTATATIAAAVLNDPGNQHDQLLALVEITAGVQAPTAVIDLRRWGPGGKYADSLLAAGVDPPLGTELVVKGVSYLRTLDHTGSPGWSAGDVFVQGFRSVDDAFTGTTFGTLSSAALPATAPPGTYIVTARARAAQAVTSAVGNLRVTAGAVNLSGDVRMDPYDGVADGTWSGKFTHTGGALTVTAAWRSSVAASCRAMPGSSVAVYRFGG